MMVAMSPPKYKKERVIASSSEPVDWQRECLKAEGRLSEVEKRYAELVEVTSNRIQQGEDSKSPHPSHYKIPGMEIEVIDIIKAKGRIATDCWQFFCWASCLQYLWRFDLRGAPKNDLAKAMVYLGWLKDANE